MKIDLVTMKFACYTLWFYTMNHGKLYLKGCNHEVCLLNHAFMFHESLKKNLLKGVILKFYMMKIVYGKTTHYMVKWQKYD